MTASSDRAVAGRAVAGRSVRSFAVAGTAVEDLVDEHRFVLRQGDAEAELVYALEDGLLVLIHTGVPPELEHRGIGGQLVEAAVARARSEHLTVVPWCPFARRWLRGHPERLGGVDVDWRTR